MNIHEACAFLSDLISVPVCVFDNEDAVRDFCIRTQLHTPNARITEEILMGILDESRQDEILLISDIFEIQTIFVHLCGSWIAIGPFCTVVFSKRDCELILKQYIVPPVSPEDLTWYRSQFPSLSSKRVLHCTNVLIRLFQPDQSEYRIREINYTADSAQSDPASLFTQKPYGLLVEERYQVEREMMNCIRNGSTAGALKNWGILHRNVSFIRKLGQPLTVAKTSAHITRTTIRIAAMDAGLPAELIDRRTGESRNVTVNAQTIDQIEQELEKLIRDICRMVQLMKQNQYSPRIFNLLCILNEKYTEPLLISDLAAEQGISVNYLITAFKKETGMTPKAYIEKLRIEKAEKLLRETTVPVQDIAAECGFADPNYFSRIFRRALRQSPLEYRKNNMR